MSPPNSFDEDMDEYEGEGNYLKIQFNFDGNVVEHIRTTTY